MKKHTQILFLALLAALTLSLSSCSETIDPKTGENPNGDRKLFIINEGGFGKGNASMDVWNFSDSLSSVAVKTAIGDVANDAQMIDGKLYVILNGSSKLISYDPTSLTTLGSIQFLSGTAPNRIVKTAEGEAMVTFLYRNEVDVIDTKADTIKYRITVSGGTKGIGVLGGKAYISNDSNGVSIINTTTRAVTEVKNLATTPYDVIVDSTRNAIVLVGVGNFAPAKPSDIVWINASDNSVLGKITLGVGDFFNSLYPSVVGKDKIYLLLGDRVAIVDLATRTITNNSFIAKGYYGGIYDAVNNQLFFGDAKDFANAGSVDIYDATTGTLKKSFPAGVIPGHFTIYKK